MNLDARFGARRLYILSLILFTAGSALCGFAWSALVKAAGPRNLARVMSGRPRPALDRPDARRRGGDNPRQRWGFPPSAIGLTLVRL